MKKIIKYLALVPLLAIMLLNCVCYGQVTATEDNTVDFPVFLDPADYTPYDFTDIEDILSNTSSTSSNVQSYLNGDLYYFYAAFFATVEDYNIYMGLSDSANTCSVTLYVLTFEPGFKYCENDSVFEAQYKSMRKYTFSYNPTTGGFTSWIYSTGESKLRFYYCKDNGSLSVSQSGYYSPPDICTKDSFYNETYFIFQSENIPELELHEDALNAGSSSSVLDVSVSFSPELTGAFSRTRYENGSKITLDNFNFTVTNNSKFSIQYLMAIYRNDEYFSPFNDDALTAQSSTKFNGKTYTGSPSYVYVKDEWIYLPHGTRGVITANAPSSWHYLSSGTSDSVSIGFEQVKLDINVDYTVVVYAVRNDANYATVFSNYNTFQYPACSDCCIEVSEITRVYSSSFNILNPATFNPNSNENSYAFDVDDSLLFNRANGYIDENGEVIVDRVDTNSFANAGKDPNDPWNGYNPDHNAWEVYYKNQNTVSSDIDQLSNNFSSFLQFVNKVFSYFPKNYQNIIILGLTSIVVLGILKVVF